MEKIGDNHYRPDRNIKEPDGLTGREKLPEQAETAYYTNSGGLDHRYVISPVIDSKTKTAMLFLPGTGQYAENFSAFIHDYNALHTNVSYFAPIGQDLSDRQQADGRIVTTRSVQDHARDLHDFIKEVWEPYINEHHPDAKKVIVGMSFGGTIVNQYTNTYEHPFDQRVFGVPMAGLPQFEGWMGRASHFGLNSFHQLHRLANITASSAPFSAATRLFKAMDHLSPDEHVYLPTEFARKWEEIKNNPDFDTPQTRWVEANPDLECYKFTVKSALNYAAAAKSVTNPSLYRKNPNPPVPTLILAGSEDEVVSQDATKDMADHIEGSVYIVLEGMKHNGLAQDNAISASMYEQMHGRIIDVCRKFSEGQITSNMWQPSLEPELRNIGNTHALSKERGTPWSVRGTLSRIFRQEDSSYDELTLPFLEQAHATPAQTEPEHQAPLLSST